MIFCGQCGLQLAAGTTRCPRCGAAVDEANIQATGDMHADDATLASHSMTVRNPTGLSQPAPQQPLILGPRTSSNDYASQLPYDATSRMEASNYSTQMQPNPNGGAAYTANYPQQSGNTYSGYPNFANRAPGGTYGGSGYTAQRGYQQQPTQGTNKTRTTALVIVVLGILFLLIAVILFALQHIGAIA